ncbi:hypothetical protein [Winkia neuii]|uniref:hypothetical protein n=1 Tax=Winkia neuii TaxID=33007 RepID=UPI0023A9E659|nr:hypothetical protein [Winkia neuii]WEB56960.1 hypothetical protein PUW65_00390 [Winkia neuii]
MGENWYLVGESRNPIRGDGAQIQTMIGRYQELGDTFENMAAFLDGSSLGDQQGKWAQTLKQESGELPNDFRKFASSFNTVGNYLADWKTKTEDSKEKARVEVRKAEAAEQDRAAASASLRQAMGHVVTAGMSAITSGNVAQVVEAQRQVSSYQTKLNEAKGRIAEATKRVHEIKRSHDDDAATTAANIESAKDDAPKLNGWERILYSDAWKVLVKVAKVVSVVLGIVACFVSGGAIAIALGAAALITVFDGFMQWRAGDKSGAEFAIDAIFGAITIIPGAKALGTGLKGLKVGKAAKAFAPKLTDTGELLQKNFSPLLKSGAFKNFRAGIAKSAKNYLRTGEWSSPLSGIERGAYGEIKGAVKESFYNATHGKDSFLNSSDGLKKVLFGDVLPSKKKIAEFNTARKHFGEYSQLYGKLRAMERGGAGLSAFDKLSTMGNSVMQSHVMDKGADVVKTFKPIVKDVMTSYNNLNDPLSSDGISLKNTCRKLFQPVGNVKDLADALK